MADTTFDNSAPEYPDLKGSNNNAANMKNSVANCKVRESRTNQRGMKPASRIRAWKDAAWPGKQDKTRGQLLAWSLPIPCCLSSALFLALSCTPLADHPQTSLQTSKLTPDKQYLH